jgi:hypothetical protein
VSRRAGRDVRLVEGLAVPRMALMMTGALAVTVDVVTVKRQRVRERRLVIGFAKSPKQQGRKVRRHF